MIMNACDCGKKSIYENQDAENASKRMKRVAFHADYSILYKCEECASCWEKVFPHGECHGDGPATLKRVDKAYALKKYNLKD